MQAHLSDSPEIKSLRALFDCAVSKAYPTTNLAHYLLPPPDGRVVVVGAGKAAAAMAKAVEDGLSTVADSLVLVPYGHKRSCRLINIVEASHPVPDKAGEKAARQILDLAVSLGADDLLVCLLSGGGSALLNLPCTGITLEEKRVPYPRTTRLRRGHPRYQYSSQALVGHQRGAARSGGVSCPYRDTCHL